MKKLFRLLCVLGILVTLLSGTVYATEGDSEPVLGASDGNTGDSMPFILDAPKYAFLDRYSDDPTVQTLYASFTKTNSLAQFMGLSADARKQALSMNGLANLKVAAQIDWAIDDPNDWHFDESWDADGKDGNGKAIGRWAYYDVDPGSEKICTVKIFEDFGDPDDKDNELWKNWKDIIPEELLSKNEENKHVYIDWTEHTLYMRVRYAVVTVDNDEENLRNTYFSAWSPVASFGKGVEEYYPYMTEADLPVPELSNLSLTDQGGENGMVLGFDVSVPKQFEEDAVRTEVYGGVAHLVYSIRFNQTGDFSMVYGDAVSGHISVPVKIIPDVKVENVTLESPVEVYAIVWIDQYISIGGDWGGTLGGGFSDTITLGIDVTPTPTPELSGDVTPTPDQNVTPTPTSLPTFTPTIEPEHVKEDTGDKEVCPVCHLGADPQFFGVCMFIWIGGAVLLLIIISIIARIIRKKQDEETDILFR